ncbi:MULTISPECIES: hypothetical protein [Bacillus]|uniref:Uncharacterized protein n=3 Tax=Bacillus thuringiensis TaxID=1428 RepID=A0AAP4Q5W9_BACTU|nr:MULTISPECIES: hypothetical protein [Bacillus]MEC0046342.1 hypothetical protein [Bacillus cereus]AFV21706.1 NADH dehydrogenase subunit 6 [Bacillus thuringiensis Bt407]EEM25265.1 NADH dehydrogenase subunit 6 [Bacillus thuringiensis Bt407]ERI01118.1 hypothetical protein BTCBT_002673 [Bacillus thuringiensis T01-328]MBN6707873.1 hypothetical protein [Bacillus thuringiensis]
MMRSYKEKYIEMKNEKELLEEKIVGLEEKVKESHEELEVYKRETVFQNSIEKVYEGLETLYKFIRNPNTKRIEINTRMRASEAEECFVGIAYEVVLYVVDSSNQKTEIFVLPVFRGGDGCMISKRACERRMDYFELTRSIAKFIKRRIKWEYVRGKQGLDIIMTEEKKESMFKYQFDISIRMNKEKIEEFKEYAEIREIFISDFTESADNETVLVQVLIDNSYINGVQDLSYVISMKETKYYLPS